MEVPDIDLLCEELRLLCSYITELSLLDLQCSDLLSFSLAVACVFLGKNIRDPNTRPQVESPYPYIGDLRHHVLILHDLYKSRRFPLLLSTREKYHSSQFECPEKISEEYFD